MILCGPTEMTDKKQMNLSIPEANECIYTSCYCEENAWKLCELTRATRPGLLSNCFVAFVSNRLEAVPIWRTKSGAGDNGLAVWDYHVIFLFHPTDGRACQVYDLDTTVGFPVELGLYIQRSFISEVPLDPELAPMFRVVGAAEFLETFASDRSRMVRPDGTWKKTPPPYPCIRTAASHNNLEHFISVDESVGIGKVYTLDGFARRFGEYVPAN